MLVSELLDPPLPLADGSMQSGRTSFSICESAPEVA
jgi:hypothetical protein